MNKHLYKTNVAQLILIQMDGTGFDITGTLPREIDIYGMVDESVRREYDWTN